MTTWMRAPVGVTSRCGGCGAIVPEGAPLLRITIARLPRALRRCEACAGAAPPDLPPLVARVAEPPPAWTRLRPPVDWQTRAAGREPGEDDA
jgi:hypothetical protein